MKKLFFISTLLFILAYTSISGEKLELKWRKLDAGIAEAKKTKKKIMLDVYTDWCKWCKKLDAEVYSEDKVSKYLEKYFVVVKLNAESNSLVTYKGKKISEIEMARYLGVSGYPTIFFLDSDGEVVDKLGGFVNAEKFLPIIKFFGEDYYKKMSWDEFLAKQGLRSNTIE